MSFSVWQTKPPFEFGPDDKEQIHQVGDVWVVTDDPARATQAEVDAVLNVKPIDVSGFVNGLKAAMGGAVAANALMRQYPMFYDALSTGTWADVQALIIDAHTTGALNDAAYAAFKGLAAQHNIPVVLS